MKKFFITLLVLLVSISSSFAQTTKKELENVIIVINSQLPISLGPSLMWKSMAMNDKEVFAKFMVNDLGNTMSNMKLSEEQLKNNVKKMLAGSDDIKNLFLTVAELGLNYHMSMTSENTGDAVDVIFTPVELQKMITSDVVSLDTKVNILLETSKSQLPLAVSTGLCIINVKKQDGLFITVVEVDENIYNLTNFQSQVALESIEKLAKTDIATICQWKILAEAGLGVRYTYVGNISKKSVNLDITNQRLKQLLVE